ncbi:putative NRAMP family protein [Helianthus annuus]|nr:putative NRAMP family protein [Helianthus annuus]
METDALTTKPQPNMPNRLLPAVLPVLFIAIAYVDPGKWVAAVEGGARFGYDLIIPMFIFSLAAVLCQYLSACITVVTGRNLAEICSSEYDAVTCIFLGVQAELSMTALDLSMVLGIAHGLNMMFGINLFTCVLLTSLDAFLFPLFSNLLETGKAKFTCVCLASFALLSYLFGVLASQPDTSLSVDGGMTIRLTGENVFAFISLLGASIMPHNFYLHSSIVQPCVLTIFTAISGVFSGIFIVNYVLMNSAANVFYSTGLDLLPFQDALSLMDQVFRSLMGPFALILILAVSNHTAALTSKFSGQPVVQNFFKLDIPVWLHHSTIRFIAIIPALMCSWHLVLRVVEFMVLGTFIGMLGLEIMFVIEMVFGNSDWASNIRWNPNPYTMILVTACASFFLMLWLVVTPLKSASFELDSVPESSTEYDRIEEFGENKVASVGSHPESPSFNLPEEILESENGLPLTTIEENSPETQISSPPEDSTTIISGGEGLKKEECKSIERTLSIDGISHVKETEQKIEAYRPEEPIKVVSEMNHVVTPDGPGSFKNLKKEDVGSGTGSWSKLAGLGRAARRQLAAVLDEFWGQLFDFHGELTQEAKTRKLDKLLGIDCKVGPSPSPNLNPNLKPNPNPNPSSMSSAQMQLLDAYARRSNLNVMDSSEKRYHSLRLQSTSSGLRIPQAASGAYNDQPATVHGYQIKSYMSQMDQLASKSPTLGSSNYKGPYSLTKGLQNGTSPAKPPGFPDPVVSRNNSMYPERSYYNHNHPVETMHGTVNEKKYYSMPDISGLSLGPKMNGLSMYSGPSGLSYASGSPLGYVGAHQLSSGSDTWSIWSRNPLEQFGVAEKANNSRLSLNLNTQDTGSTVDLEANLLKSLRLCIVKLLKLEGSDWLFQQDSGLDEDLVDRVAARERFLFEVESKEMNGLAQPGDPGMKIDLVTSIPNCGEGCVWRADLITSFGVWSIHRVLELSLMESRPELWGKYTYVLNRLQGIIELAFSKPRAAMSPCFCLQLPTSYHQRKASPPKSATSLPPPAKQSKGKCTTAASLLDIVKDVEIAISCRKGRTGTAAGDVAFPKGKENLASVLKRYKRRLSNKPAVAPDALNKSSYCGL